MRIDQRHGPARDGTTHLALVKAEVTELELHRVGEDGLVAEGRSEDKGRAVVVVLVLLKGGRTLPILLRLLHDRAERVLPVVRLERASLGVLVVHLVIERNDGETDDARVEAERLVHDLGEVGVGHCSESQCYRELRVSCF